MSAKPPLRLPQQPNPFGSSASGNPWTAELADVPSINHAPFELIVSALQQLRSGGSGTSIVLTGEPGSGKTHLLGRLRSRIEQDERDGRGPTPYIYIRCNASPTTLWRHLRLAIASDLVRARSSLHSGRLEQVNHWNVRRALEHLRSGRHFLAASAWLRGESLGPADLSALGFASETDLEENDREWEANQVVDCLLDYLHPAPIVLCLDQVEAMATFHGDAAGFHALGKTIAALADRHERLLLVSCIVNTFELQLERLPNEADRDRWLKQKGLLRSIDWEQAVELIKTRLAAAPALSAARQAHPDQPLWPLHPDALQPLFEQNGLCLPRTLIRECERQFSTLLDTDREEIAASKSLPDFLADQFEQALKDARPIVAQQGLSKTLSDCLPWLLQNSRMMPMGHDQALSAYANMAWRGPNGDVALTFCDKGGVSLANKIKQIGNHWNGHPRLLILRDPAIQPGAKTIEYLTQLKQRGVSEVHPLPEALAALQAIRNLVATARSGELFNGPDLVSEQAVSAWAQEHLPPPLTALRDTIAARPAQAQALAPDDPALPRLAELLAAKKIVAAQAAAEELQLTPEVISECARRYPMRFGILAGPPVVVFEATQAAAPR